MDLRGQLPRHAVAIAVIAGAVGLLVPFRDVLNTTTIALGLLLVILVVASSFGSRPAILASVLGVLGFNFFFLSPVHTFTIDDPQNWVALTAFLMTALIAGQLSSYARRRARESEERRREIERLYEELRGAFEQASQAEALRQSEQLKSALLDAVTHDLCSPLTSIKAAVTTLQKESPPPGTVTTEPAIELDPEQRGEFLDIIEQETDRLEKFVNEMVRFARIQAGEAGVRRTFVDIREIISNALERIAQRTGSRRVTVVIERDLPLVMTDAVSLEEVIYNLADNAVKYSPDGSEIRLTAARADGDMVSVAVEDQGKGIEPELRPMIFEKFYRETSGGVNSNSTGLGLGLAIAKGIVESHGGSIGVTDAAEGFRTRFVFSIPIGDD